MHVEHYRFIYCDFHKQFVLRTLVFWNSVKAVSQLLGYLSGSNFFQLFIAQIWKSKNNSLKEW